MPVEIIDKHIDSNSNIVLWKYLDLWKFESLLKESATFFCRADKFPDDPFEGSIPPKVKDKRFKDIMSSELFHGNSNITRMHNENEMISKFTKNVLRKLTLVNCWHMSDSECNLMWNSYVENKKIGVVIKTDIKKLISSFENTPENIMCSFAYYLDYKHEDWLKTHDSFDLIAPFIHKKKGFTKEKELRLFHQIQMFNGKELDDFWQQQKINNGINIKLDLNRLIDEIYCSPQANQSDIENINRTIIDNGFSFNAKKSDISSNEKPIF